MGASVSKAPHSLFKHGNYSLPQGPEMELIWLERVTSGRSSVLDMTILTGACPPSRRVVSRGLSRRTYTTAAT